MPARIVLVHDDQKFLDDVAQALRASGHLAATFSGSMEALSALEAAQTIELLITRVNFPPGTPNGVALARMARFKRPGINVLFTAASEMNLHTEGIGELMPMPIDLPALVKRVGQLLEPDQ